MFLVFFSTGDLALEELSTQGISTGGLALGVLSTQGLAQTSMRSLPSHKTPRPELVLRTSQYVLLHFDKDTKN